MNKITVSFEMKFHLKKKLSKKIKILIIMMI